ncbi:membrane dipeptidase [Facklamia sp. DSM 111018]|uniref:Membrane dipeptidase n=1 Tax=Facklamia lactis TaxID=2749967 RepID=A0ABS0LPM1_9LACT|nr:dipeptidase [Facklamia lactis]MBG9980292.1 membrane dipeptidase [Facklamia lactis]MBG9986095.1 membrane dipeptidase [Facklamia lactis]
MNYIDLHCDTLMMTWQEEAGENIIKNQSFAVDFERLSKAGAYAQFFAIFMLYPEIFEEIKRPVINDWEYITSLVQQLNNGLKQTEKVKLAKSFQDLNDNLNHNIVSAFLTLEDGRPLESDLNNLYRLYDLGIRLITLTWNFENSLAYPNSKDPSIMNKGLKAFGFEVMEEMNRLGMIIDVSHLSDGGFFDLIKHSKDPIMASHSNARSLSNHPRNLTDEMIYLLADKGGIMGLNFCSSFLSADQDCNVSRIDDMVRHLNYIKKLVGIEVLALGTDFEGITCQLEIDSTDKLDLLFKRLDHEGWTSQEIEDFAYGNALRFIKEVL